MYVNGEPDQKSSERHSPGKISWNKKRATLSRKYNAKEDWGVGLQGLLDYHDVRQLAGGGRSTLWEQELFLVGG